jgi:hypothetical protein
MWYVLFTPGNGYIVVQANDELERQQYETHSYYQSVDKQDCDNWVDGMTSQGLIDEDLYEGL